MGERTIVGTGTVGWSPLRNVPAEVEAAPDTFAVGVDLCSIVAHPDMKKANGVLSMWSHPVSGMPRGWWGVVRAVMAGTYGGVMQTIAWLRDASINRLPLYTYVRSHLLPSQLQPASKPVLLGFPSASCVADFASLSRKICSTFCSN